MGIHLVWVFFFLEYVERTQSGVYSDDVVLGRFNTKCLSIIWSLVSKTTKHFSKNLWEERIPKKAFSKAIMLRFKFLCHTCSIMTLFSICFWVLFFVRFVTQWNFQPLLNFSCSDSNPSSCCTLYYLLYFIFLCGFNNWCLSEHHKNLTSIHFKVWLRSQIYETQYSHWIFVLPSHLCPLFSSSQTLLSLYLPIFPPISAHFSPSLFRGRWEVW